MATLLRRGTPLDLMDPFYTLLSPSGQSSASGADIRDESSSRAAEASHGEADLSGTTQPNSSSVVSQDMLASSEARDGPGFTFIERENLDLCSVLANSFLLLSLRVIGQIQIHVVNYRISARLESSSARRGGLSPTSRARFVGDRGVHRGR